MDFKKLISNIKAPKFDSMDKKEKISLVLSLLVVLMHIALFAALVLSYRYFALYPNLFLSLVGLLLCVVLVVDIFFVVGSIHKDFVMKVVSTVMAALILVVSSVGTYYVNKVNKAVGNVMGFETSNEALTDTVDGIIAIRSEEAKYYTDLSDLAGKSVGYVKESETGVATIGLAKIDETKVDYAPIGYDTYDELIISLNDEKIDAAIFIDGYRGLYSKTAENGTASDDAAGADYTGIISTFTDYYSFSEEIDLSATASNKNISTDPFNILLIGWSRTDIGSKVGLADAIIVASVNPKTYTVSMMSIARDSYVPISCYGGTKDKINSARGTSRACFIKTVEDYTGMTMDFYMEADYEAVVEVVDAIEGIEITNPVEFELDGVYVPAGTYTAWGWQVLEFCRERHHMPNGDFDRQQHQKEVIIAIAEKLLRKADITLFLNAIEAAGDKFSTNLTLNQLTGMFNMILQTKNYTGMKVGKLIDFQQLRLTGYSDWYYNYSMALPLWIYKIYQGSYDESMQHAKDVLGIGSTSITQNYTVSYDANNPYERPLFYSLSYNEEQIHEIMPAYFPNFVGYTYAEAVSWATYNKVSLNFNFISSHDAGYDESKAGLVVSQSIRYGQLLTVGTNTLTIMGESSVIKVSNLPNYDGWSYERMVEWAEAMGYRYALRPTASIDISKDDDGIIWKVDVDEDEEGDILKIRYYTYCNPDTSIIDDDGKCVICSHTYTEEVKKTATCTEDGLKVLTCSKCGNAKNETIPKLGHNYVVDSSSSVAATCTEAGKKVSKCSRCNDVKTEVVPALGHTEEVTDTATCDAPGTKTTKCKVCGSTLKTEDSPAKGHDWETISGKAATCTEEGYTEHKKCKRCGTVEGKNIVTALGHTPVEVEAKEPTIESEGRTAGTKCSVCGTILSGCETIPKLTPTNPASDEENNNSTDGTN